MLAVLWDDFDLRALAGNGAVFTATDGDPGARRFIVSWQEVPQYNGGALGLDSSSFQIIFYETGGFEYRYGALAADFSLEFDAGTDGATVGVEDAFAGSASYHQGTGNNPVTGGTSLLFSAGGGCATDPCDVADFNGDGFLNPDDLSDFITCFFLEVQFPGTCPDADFNGDAFLNPDDLSDYITTFFLCV
jgi:hypothetical protein